MAAFDLDADQHVLALHAALRDGSYQPGDYVLWVVRDPKVRLVAAAPLVDRVLQQALVGELAPHYERSFIDQQFGCRTGRGPHRAAICFLGAMRRFRYRLCLDIRRYFPSIHRPTLRALFARKLRDSRTLGLLDQVLAAGGAVYTRPLAIATLGLDAAPLAPDCGMPIGSLLSHFSGALYLDGLDHFLKRQRKIAGYLRYMDDFVLFGDDARQLEAERDAIVEWLAIERGLELNPKRWHVADNRQPASYLGFRISRGGIAPGRKLRRNLHQRILEAAERGGGALERTLLSYRGMVE